MTEISNDGHPVFITIVSIVIAVFFGLGFHSFFVALGFFVVSVLFFALVDGIYDLLEEIRDLLVDIKSRPGS